MAHVNPGSTWHVEEHPSPLALLPSSHCSPVTMSLSPQIGTQTVSPMLLHAQFHPGSSLHVELQPSPEAVLPSSHCSPRTISLSPQIGAQSVYPVVAS